MLRPHPHAFVTFAPIRRANIAKRQELAELTHILHRRVHGGGPVATCAECRVMGDPSWGRHRLSPVRRTVRGKHRRR